MNNLLIDGWSLSTLTCVNRHGKTYSLKRDVQNRGGIKCRHNRSVEHYILDIKQPGYNYTIK